MCLFCGRGGLIGYGYGSGSGAWGGVFVRARGTGSEMGLERDVPLVEAWRYWVAVGSVLMSVGLVTLSVATGEVSRSVGMEN